MKKYIKLLTIVALTFVGATSAFAADTISTSEYFDTDNDGTIDTIVWTFDENVSSCAFDSADWIYNSYGPFGTFNVSAVSCDGSPALTLTIDGADADVTGGAGDPVIGYRQNNGTANSIVLASGNLTDKSNIHVADKAAPVIISSSVNPAHIQVDEETVTDDNVGFFHYTATEEVNGLSPSGTDGFDTWGTNGTMYLEFPVGNRGIDPRPDYENPDDANSDHNYEYAVRLIDGDGNQSQVYNFHVELQDVNENPIITSNGGGNSTTIHINENTTAVTTVTATDEDAGQTLTYSITGGPGTPDGIDFTIDPNTGVLSFTTAPDFENPTDRDTIAPGDQSDDNEYVLMVRATDNGAGNLYDSQTIDVIVDDVNESTSTGHSRARRSKATKKQSPQQKQKQALLKQIEELQRLIKDIQAQKKGDDRLAKCPTFNQNLRKGSRGEEVRKVQTFLKQQELFTFPTITGYYGTITQKAVAAFQAKYSDEILKPLGLTNPTGNWFGKTIAKANTLAKCSE